ncbi:MAG: adenylate/guanylate cyclase domain-containing protein [Actinomycetia bacterium]|nr:adenylate/guanylate cyclase domain-containing protein [Actinomycetes bacterium]
MTAQPTTRPDIERDLIDAGPNWIRSIADCAAADDDAVDVRVQKRVLVVATVIAMIIVTPWGLFYIWLGVPVSGAIPLVYVAISFVFLVLARRTRSIGVLLPSQLGMFLILPPLVHISLGGFTNSSGVVMYSTVVPIAALSFANSKRSGLWFLAFAAIVVGLVPFENALKDNAPELSNSVIAAFFAVNIVATAMIGFLSLDIYVRSRNRLASDLAFERARSDSLLLNVLPRPVAKRLRDGEAVIADRHDHVAVLFADIVGFTPLSETMSAEQLVADLNNLFSAFDRCVEIAGVEKVKTIGDSYMAMSGTDGSPADLGAIIALARDFHSCAAVASIGDRSPIEIRCGIDVGPAVTGVIGTTRFIYDVYGATVNMASRMESHGLPGEIQVTERVRDQLSDCFVFEKRGPINIKGVGPTITYLVKA